MVPVEVVTWAFVTTFGSSTPGDLRDATWGDIRDHGIGSVRLTGGFASRLVFVCKLPIFVDRRFKTGMFLIVRIVFLGKVQALRRLCRRHVVAILREGLQSPRRHADAERQHRSHEIA